MLKKRTPKFLIFILCAILSLPLSIFSFQVKASTTPISAYVGVEFSIAVSDEVKALDKGVEITAKEKDDSTATVIFTNGNAVKDLANYTVNSYSNGELKCRIKTAGEYSIIVKGTGENASTTFEKVVNVYSDIDNSALKSPSYSYDDAGLTAYKQKVADGVYVDASANPKVYLSMGSTYKVPSIKELIDLGFLSYGQYKRTVYYSAPGSNSYSTATATGALSELEFTLSKIGAYRFYVTLTSDLIDGKAFNLVTKGLKEYDDGFYAVQTVVASGETPTRLYYNGTNYYTNDSFESEYIYEITDEKTQIEKVDAKPIIPIFEFEVGNSGPVIKISSNPEKGYVDLEYTMGRITVSGNEVVTTYELEYSTENAPSSFKPTKECEDEAVKAIEYNSSTGKFIPTAKGYYRVKVSVVDADGLADTKYSKIIHVTEKYQPVKYVTSFGDWLKVNYVPFIFLCVSGLCLIGIILLLVIKPKNKDEDFADNGIDE